MHKYYELFFPWEKKHEIYVVYSLLFAFYKQNKDETFLALSELSYQFSRFYVNKQTV